MKKLTAGIFTVLLGLVSINSAEAAVASQGYVDAKFSSVGGNVDTLTQTVADNKAAAENALKTEKEAREAADSALDGRVTSAEGKLTTLQGDENVVGSVAKSIADAIGGLSAASVGAEGSFISTVSQADGTIAAEKTAFVDAISDTTKDSTIAPQTKAVKVYVDTKFGAVSDANSEVAQKVASLEEAVTADGALIDQFTDYKTANDAALAAEAKTRGDADTALQSALNLEIAAREATDGVVEALEGVVVANKAAAEGAIADEAAARATGDADTLAAAKKYADDQDTVQTTTITNAYTQADAALKTELEEKIADAAGDASDVAADLATEIAAREQGDADTLAAAKTDAANKADAALAAAKEDATTKANAAQAAAATDATTKADAALAAAKADAASKDAALKEALEKYADQAESDAIATAGTNADTKISNLNLNQLSRVPAACSDDKNYCVLTSDGSKYLWEVITRDDNEVQPQGTDIPSVK